jgi:hypothetical protein
VNRKTISFDNDVYATIRNYQAKVLTAFVNVLLKPPMNELCRANSLGQFIKVYRVEWVIAEFNQCFLQQVSGNRISLYVAVNRNSGKIMTGVDIVDLEADISESMR